MAQFLKDGKSPFCSSEQMTCSGEQMACSSEQMACSGEQNYNIDYTETKTKTKTKRTLEGKNALKDSLPATDRKIKTKVKCSPRVPVSPPLEREVRKFLQGKGLMKQPGQAGSKERGQLKFLIKSCSDRRIPVLEFLSWVFTNWADIRKKVRFDGSKKSRLGINPTYQEIAITAKQDLILSYVNRPKYRGKNNDNDSYLKTFTKGRR